MKTRKDIKLGKSEEFVEDIRDNDTRCPKCGGILIANFGEGISVEFCAEDNCDYEDYDYEQQMKIVFQENNKTER